MPTNLNDTPSRGPLTANDLREHWPGCAGPCDQGRRLCPCPEACARLDRHGREINRYTRLGAELVAWFLAVLVICALVNLGLRLYDMARPATAAVDCAKVTT